MDTVAKIASILPFFSKGILVLELTSTISAIPCPSVIISVNALAISTSNPTIACSEISYKPKSFVSDFTPPSDNRYFLLRYTLRDIQLTYALSASTQKQEQ